MPTLDRTAKQKLTISTMVLTFFIGLLLFGALLIAQAAHLSSVSSASSAEVAIGPLKLVTLQKTPLPGGGNSASITYEPGIFMYFGIVLAIGVLISWYRVSRFEAERRKLLPNVRAFRLSSTRTKTPKL